MHILDVIETKRDDKVLTDEQISFFVEGVAKGAFPDYQISAFLMAAFIRGLNDGETAFLTHKMAVTGDTVDLSFAGGTVVDKHSSGGVGDKTTLVVAPMAAACGLKIAKMSGRGLDFTGGTLDKLEAIPGFSTNIPEQDFKRFVARDGISVIGQTAHVAPVDKALYRLRDVTGTVSSLPLIASSIMSKKLAVGSDAVVLDVKTGSGAFMRSLSDAKALAEKMVAIGKANGRRTVAAVTNMDQPLGREVGNSLEVIEAVDTLRGNGPADFTELCMVIASLMLISGEVCDNEAAARELLSKTIADGSALAKLRRMVVNQGGDPAYIDDTSLFRRAAVITPVLADESGWLNAVETNEVGRASALLGAGRFTVDDVIDPAAGITVCKKTGDKVEKGEPLCYIHTDRESAVAEAAQKLRAAFKITLEETQPNPSVYTIIQ